LKAASGEGRYFLDEEDGFRYQETTSLLTGFIIQIRTVMNIQTRFATISFLNALLLASVVVVVRHRIGAS
jgi:hypothetical protein